VNPVVVHSPAALPALRAAARWIEPLLGTAEIVIAGATRAAADEFVRLLPGPGTLGLHRFTIMQLAASLAGNRIAEEGLAPATRLAAEAIAARAIHDALKQGGLAYFAPVAKSPGFPSALANTATDLRLAHAKPQPGTDIALLLELYERELESRRLADSATVLEFAAEAARQGQHAFAGLPLLLLDVPIPSRAHYLFLEALARSVPAFFAAVLSADAARRDALERISGVAATPELDDGSTALARLREQLFAAVAPTATDYDESVDLFSAPGEALECVEIARRIRALGTPFDRVAILLRHPDRYQPLVEEALRRADIPAYFSRGTAKPDPAGRAFLALLACASEGCSATRFAEYLSLGQVPPLDGQGAPPRREVEWTSPEDEMLAALGAAPAREDAGERAIPEATSIATPLAWEKLLVDAAVIGGYERWARRLRGLEQEFRLQLQSLGAEEQARRERIERDLERLGNLERFALPLIEDLHSLPASAHWEEWLGALSQLAARALVNPEPVLTVLAELRPMAEVGPVDLDEVRTVLSERLLFLRRDPPHRRYGRVFVGSIDEARGRVFDLVFLPGLAEGLFPRKASEDPLLLDESRRAISPDLTTRTDQAGEERLLLRTAVAAAGSRFIASYPSMDLTQGRPRVPSFYALEIARAIEGVLPNLRRFETKLSENSEARLIWPAPPDPTHAIDDAEYDLAWMAKHRCAPHLRTANPHLARSLEARRARWESVWCPADGIVDPEPATRSKLEPLRLARRAYSPSALQNFAACPYRFYLAGMLHIEERTEAAAIEQLDPLTRGALLHEVQFRFFREWRAQPTGKPQEILYDVLGQVAAEYAEKIAPAIERVWVSELDDLRMDLGGWLNKLLETIEWLEPAHFELAFGLPPDGDHDPASSAEPVEAGGALLRGSIDLVEVDRQFDTLRITDHKTGKPPEKEPVMLGGGTVLQPVLYALAAEKLLGKRAETGRLFYCTQRGNYQEITIPINDRARQCFGQAMKVVDEAIAAGFLPAAPAEGACGLCEYRPVCGPHEETRVKRWKDKDALSRLYELRSMM
jgi:ATP-dependent helicase/nuclease subunit B